MLKGTTNWDLNLYKINSIDNTVLPEPYGSNITIGSEVYFK